MDNKMFSLSDATVEIGSKYLEPGINEVKLTGVELLTSQKGKPYIRMTVADSTGATCVHNYSLDTDINPGKEKSAWSITKNSILQLGIATIGEAKTRTAMESGSPQEFATKLATSLTGKPFRLKVVGEEVMTQAGNKFTKAHFGSGYFAEATTVPADQSKLKFDPIKNIKRLPTVAVEETPAPWLS